MLLLALLHFELKLRRMFSTQEKKIEIVFIIKLQQRFSTFLFGKQISVIYGFKPALHFGSENECFRILHFFGYLTLRCIASYRRS